MRYKILAGSHISYLISHLDLLALINEFFELFARFEIGDAFCGDIDSGAGFWIAAFSRIAFANAKAAKSAELNFLALVQGARDAVKNDLDQHFGVLFCHVRVPGDFFN
jgi:hypothetical protein